jgi:hypothetical protein
MPVYHLHHTGYVSHVETVEADTPEAAIDASEEGWVSLCHQCTREWDSAGDPEITSVTDETGEIVWEPEREPARAPLPTQEQISEAILAAWIVQTELGVQATPVEHSRALAGGVMKLLNGGTS